MLRDIQWTNYFVRSIQATARDGHVPAETLREVIKNHDGTEAYHCAYDLEAREDFTGYSGLMRPSLGFVWFDFDSGDGGVGAHEDTRRFIEFLQLGNVFVCYSGSKGFHVGVPFSAFGLQAQDTLGKILNRLAQELKKSYTSLDTTIYNANRKFRALGTKHPKTGRYKICLSLDELRLPLANIKQMAERRGSLEIPVPPELPPLKQLTDLLARLEQVGTDKTAQSKDKAQKSWDAPSGRAAFNQCGFLQLARDEQAKISEPQWYAALSVVSRFQDGRKQCHGISHKHTGYSATDCNAKIDQALQESAPRTCENISTLWDGCARCPLYGKINSPVNIFDRKFWDVGKNGNLLPQYNELLEEFVKHKPYKTIADMKTVFTFGGTHYEEFTPIEIKAFAEEKFEPKPKEKERQEFAHKVFANSIEKRNFFLATTRDKINFLNGVLDVSSDAEKRGVRYVLQNHSKEFGFRGVLPYNYDRNGSCPTFEWWIKDVMLGDEALVAILQEFMGYVIRGGEYTFHKALWLSGSGRNGKSTFLSVLKALIGNGNYSTLSIRQIISDKFSSADLDGKIANFSEETSPEELSDSGPFKNLTGDGELLAQKKYGDPYSFRNRAKLIMTYNEVPELRDLSPGMLSRPIIVPWKKDLTKDESQDKKLKEKLFAELSGIFNWAYAGWERLEKNEAFSFSPKAQLELDRVRAASCSALQWVQNYVTFLPIDTNSAKQVMHPMELYEAYVDKERYAYKPMKFFKRINELAEIKERRGRDKKSSYYFALMLKQKPSTEY